MKSVKIFIVLLAVVCASILCISNDVFASSEYSFDEIMMVDDYSSINEQDVFGLDETPWLYLKVPESQFSGPLADLNFTFSFFESPQDTKYFVPGVSLQRENWISLTSWDSIPNNAKVGNWDVYANFVGSAGVGYGKTNFTVNPEPISMILFLFGGMPLAASLYRKKKKVLCA